MCGGRSACAYRAQYSDSALVPPKDGGPAEPRPCAGVKGAACCVALQYALQHNAS